MSHMTEAVKEIKWSRPLAAPCWFSPFLNKRGLFLQGFRDNDIEDSILIMHFKQEAKSDKLKRTVLGVQEVLEFTGSQKMFR